MLICYLQLKYVCRAPGVSRLLFADDTLLLFKATHDKAVFFKQTLDAYASPTSQLINPCKCSLLFGDSCPTNVHGELRSVLGVTALTFNEKYLGLPAPDSSMP
jgi:hypothetical protein